MKKKIWGNCVIKNEDRFIWFSIKSVIGYLDKILIYDTGSQDKTVRIIKSLQKEYPDKIVFRQKREVDSAGLTKLRQEMLEETQSDWLLLLDGDEIWWEESIKKITNLMENDKEELYAFVNPVINLIGDMFHFQEEKAGEYQILGMKGHFNIRAINRNIPGLHLANDYPLEGFFDKEGRLIQSVEDKLRFVDLPILHASHLKRSSLDDSRNTLYRNKIKIELGESFPKNFEYPEVFYLPLPEEVENPFKKMDWDYKIRAALITPLKKIKRRLKS